MSAVALLAGLESFRRRAGLVAGLSAALASASAVAAAAELLQWSGAAAGAGALMTLMSAAIAGTTALGVTWMRRPALGDVARTVDARLGLQAVVITAFQCREEGDVFAARTVTRATQALAGAGPGDVYPWQVSRATLWLTAASGGVVLLLMAGPDPLPGAQPFPGGAAGTQAGSLPVRRAANSTPGVTPSGGAAPASSADASSPSERNPQTKTDPAANASGDARVGRGGLGAESQPAIPDGRREPASSASAGSGTDTARPHGGIARTGESLTSGGTSGQSGSIAAPGGGQRSGPNGSTASNPPHRGAAGTGDATAAVSPSFEEQALALERVPMSRRTYVQRYLRSLGLGRE